MIARITGRLEAVENGSALIDTGNGLAYEVLIPAGDVGRVSRHLGQEVLLYTIHYVEGDPGHGSQTERLVGFLRPEDREFFRTFTTVKGIGIRKALRALSHPVSEVAAAIQAKDAKFLVDLPEIGKRTAEQIIATLYGKVESFAGPTTAAALAEMSEPALEAVSVLVQLGERRADAMALVERVMSVSPDLTSPETIIQHAYKLKSGGM